MVHAQSGRIHGSSSKRHPETTTTTKKKNRLRNVERNVSSATLSSFVCTVAPTPPVSAMMHSQGSQPHGRRLLRPCGRVARACSDCTVGRLHCCPAPAQELLETCKRRAGVVCSVAISRILGDVGFVRGRVYGCFEGEARDEDLARLDATKAHVAGSCHEWRVDLVFQSRRICTSETCSVVLHLVCRCSESLVGWCPTWREVVHTSAHYVAVLESVSPRCEIKMSASINSFC